MITKQTATVDDSVLRKVSCIFDGSPDQIFHELLQNARRAGADDVKIRIDGRGEVPEVTVTDNGKGIEEPTEDAPWSFLRYGGSRWRPNAEDEDPAGMGAFALSAFDEVNVLTLPEGGKPYHARITSKAFHGIEPVMFDVIDNVYTHSTGTEISFKWRGDGLSELDAFYIFLAAKGAAEYCGLKKVTVTDKDAFSETSKEFLSKPFVDAENDDCLFVEDHPGYTIGVYRKDKNWVPLYSRLKFNANFRGVSVSVLPDFCLGENKNQLNELVTATRDYEVRVDIKHLKAGGLRMVLPARNAFKKDASYDELIEKLRNLTLRLPVVLGWENHSLPYYIYAEAEANGIKYPPLNLEKVLTRPWYFESCLRELVTQPSVSEAQKSGKKLALCDGALPSYLSVAAAEGCNLAFFNASTIYTQYPEVKNLPKVDEDSVTTYVRWADELCYCKVGRVKEEIDDEASETYLKLSLISVESGEVVHEVVLVDGHDWGGELTFDDLHLGFDLSDGERVTVRHNWAPVYWADHVDLHDIWEPSLIVLSSAAKHDDSTIDVMAEELAALSFSGSDDFESPPMEDQWRNHRTYVKALLIDNLQDYKKAMEYALRSALENVRVGYSEKVGWTVEQVFDAEGKRKLEITIGDKRA